MACKHGTNFMELCPECELEAMEHGLPKSPSDLAGSMPNRVIGVALMMKEDGMVYSASPPKRHHHLLQMAECLGYSTPIQAEQGFMLNNGKFATRKAAAHVAIKSGQIEKVAHPHHGLFSEDVW